jgi:hypothetical protein
MKLTIDYLTNEIIKWENLYGQAYTYCYDETGSIRNDISIDDRMFDYLQQAKMVLQVLNKVKRNRNKPVKRQEIRKYKITRGV